jgi:Ca2+-binding RTX toxin-like protein
MALTAATKTDLYRFFAIAFNAAPGVTYMSQLATASESGMTVRQIVDVFTTKPEFTASYPNFFTDQQFATKLVDTVVGNAATTAAKAEAVADIQAALAAGLSKGTVIFNVFSNLAALTGDAKWGGTATQLANKVAVAQYYTEDLLTDSTNLTTLRNVIANVTNTTDVSTPAALQAAITASTPAESKTLTLTTGLDTGTAFTGGSANDTFNSVLIGQNGTGTTLNAGDVLTGGAGNDVLSVSVSGAAAAAATTTTANAVQTTGIERVAVNNFNTLTMNAGVASATFDASLFDSSLATIALASSSSTANQGNTAFTNLTKIVSAEMNNGQGDLSLTYQSSAVGGTADAMSLSLSNQTGGTFTAAGIETLNLASNGSSNTITLVGAQLTTVNVTGSKNLSLTNPATVTKVLAADLTGNLTVAADQAVAYSIVGGSGNDKVTVTAGSLTAADTINGGTGTDTVVFTAPVTTANAAGVTGFEVLEANANNAAAYDVSALNSTSNPITRLAASAAAAGDTVTFSNVGSAVTDISVTGTEGVIVTLKTNGTADSIKVTYGTAATASSAGTGVTVAGQTTLSQYETIALVSQGAANSTGDFSAGELKTLTVSGDKSLTLGTMNAANTSISSIDASAMTLATAAFIMTDNTSTTASTITGGAGNDTLFGGTKADSISGGSGIDSIVGGDGADTISGGDGNDSITGGAGIDNLSGGTGDDTFNVTAAADFASLASAEVVSGGDGNDTLKFTVNAATSIVAADLAGISSIETIEFAGDNTSSVVLTDAVYTSNGVTNLKVVDSENAAALTVSASALTAANSITVTASKGAAISDNLVGGAGADVFNFTTSSAPNAYTADDTVTGGSGTDTVNITLATNNLTAFTTTNTKGIESIVVTGSGALTAGLTLSNDTFATVTAAVVNASGMTGTGAFTLDASAEVTSTLSVTGGSGADNLTGGQVNDTIVGGGANDTIIGHAGVDSLSGGEGDDTFQVGTVAHFIGLAAPETVSGGAGNDVLKFTDNAATSLNSTDLLAVSSVETIEFNGTGTAALVLTDAVFTANGLASLKITDTEATAALTVNASGLSAANSVAVTANTGGAISDSLAGGSGNDTFTFSTANSATALAAADSVNGGAGTDTLTISTATNALTGFTFANVSLIERVTMTGSKAVASTGTKLDFGDGVFASLTAATIDASGITADGIFITAASEDDSTLSITGSAVADEIIGGQLADTIRGGVGSDTITGGLGADSLTGGNEADTFVYAAVAQSNSSNTDSITDWTSASDKLQITLDYSSIVSPLTVDATVKTARAGTALIQDNLSGARGETVYDTTGSSLYVNVNADNLLTTSDYKIGLNPAATATATVAEGDINFVITGGSNADTITAGGGADTIDGGAGADSITAGAGADSITAGSGIDTITGGTGNDTIVLGGGTDADVIVTGATASANGVDTVTGFVVGNGGDILNFGAFFTEDNAFAAVTANPGGATNITNKVYVIRDIAGGEDVMTAAGLTTAVAAGGEYANIDMTASTKAVALTYTAGATTTVNVYYLTSDAGAVITATLVGTITTDATAANLTDQNFS